VLQEICNAFKKFELDEASISKTLSKLDMNFKVKSSNLVTINKVLQIHFKYQYSYYDPLIIASALQNECSILYFEELHHN